MSEKIKIAIDGRRPVSIDPETWPTVAKSSWHEGQIACQSNRRAWCKVRQHADGRSIVYARHESSWANEADRYSGAIGTAVEIPAMVVLVCRRIGMESLANECLADLSAEEL